MPEEQKKEVKNTRSEKTKETKTVQQKPVEMQKEEIKPQPLPQNQGNSSAPWMIATILLLIISIVLGMIVARNLTAKNIVEKELASKEISALLNKAFGVDLELDTIEEKEDLYEITYQFSGRKFLILTTKDLAFIRLPNGNWLRKADLDETKETREEESPEMQEGKKKDSTSEEITIEPTVTVTKSGKPKAELFVMSLCPYTIQAEKGLLPALEVLKDKIDFSINYMHYILQGAKEDEENKRQICIREEQKSKFLLYLKCFLNSSKSLECIKTAGIDAVKLDSCIKNKAVQYYLNDSKASKSYEVEKSPTLFLNGKATSFFPRDSSTALDILCSAFTTKPAECSLELPTENPSAAFGAETDDKNIEGFCG